MRLDEWRRRGRSFPHGAHQIFYVVEGQGEALLCIHGFPTASWDWHRIWPDLVARFRVIAADLIGFGFSDKPRDHAYSIEDQATLLENLLAALDVRQVHVLAHDYGDTVAQELLARHEERRGTRLSGLELRSVCFLNGGLFPEAHRARTIQKLLRGPLGPVLSRLLRKGRFRRSFAAVFGPRTQPSEAELDDFWSLVAHHDGARISHRLIRYLDERRRQRERWVGVLQTTRVPLRLIDGPADPVSGAHMAARYRELVPNPDVVLLEPHVGHYPQIEQPAGVRNAFFEFVDRAAAR